MSMGWGAARKLRRRSRNLRAHPRGGAGVRGARRSTCARRCSPAPARAPRWPPCATRVAGPGPDRWLAPELAAGRGAGASAARCWRAVEARDRGAAHERPREVRAPRGTRALLPGLAAGGRAADADEQPRPRGRRAPRRPRRLRRHRPRGALVGGLRRDRRARCATLEDDETLLVQSGKPVGVFRTHEWAPRVLIANSNLVPDWATWDEFRRLEAARADDVRADDRRLVDLHRHARASCRAPTSASPRSRGARFGGSLAGTITLTAGLGGMGGAQPLAVTMNDGVALCVEVDRAPHRAPARDALPRRAGRLDSTTRSRAAARAKARAAAPLSRRAASATPPTCCRELLRRGFEADIVTDQTSAHDPLDGYVPDRHRRWRRPPQLRARDPDEYVAPRARVDGGALRGDGRLHGRAARRCSTTATACAPRRKLGGFERAFDYPGFVPAYIRPLFCEGKGPFRWVALSGDPADIAATDRAVLEEFPDDERLARWIRDGRRADRVPGAAGAHLLARLRRARTGSGCASTRWCAAASCRRRS